MIPTLDPRLCAVLDFIQADAQPDTVHTDKVHADIGSDHAHLPIRLVQLGRVRRCIVVELNPGPLAHARRNVALAGLTGQIEVREGSGFAPLHPGEVHSVSITGMGANTMLGILEGAADRLSPPLISPALVLQPNDSPTLLRQWAREHGFHLLGEMLAAGHWAYPVLHFAARPGPDPVYHGLPEAAALRYGPHLLRGGCTLTRRQVWNDVVRLTPLAAPGRPAQEDLQTAKAALEVLEK